jgi:hypothetical protein
MYQTGRICCDPPAIAKKLPQRRAEAESEGQFSRMPFRTGRFLCEALLAHSG